MKKQYALLSLLLMICVAAVMAGAWAVAQVAPGGPAGRPLSEWIPSGALLYVESSDFATQLRDWNSSDVKAEWLTSKNYEAFLTTRLVLKLQDVYGEFSGAAGFAPNLTELATIAGTDTALALYDIGKLEFVYVSHLTAAPLAQNVLTRVQTGYQTRNAGGVPYFVRQAGTRTAAFAIAGEYVVVSTREDLLVAALGLIQGNSGGSSVGQEMWYRDAVQALPASAGQPFAFRMVMDFANVVTSPYFRSYWIQKNASDLTSYYSYLSQVTRRADALEENRVLLRTDPAEIAHHDAVTVELQKYIPEEAGLFRLWDSASSEFALNLIHQKFFSAGPAASQSRQFAPAATLNETGGSETDLQTRIDSAPKPSLAGALDLTRLNALLERADIEAVLQLESSVKTDDVTYVRSDAAVALKAASVWNAADVRVALTEAVGSYQTVRNIGLQWRNVVSGGYTLSQWDGLSPLTMYVDGQILWIARTPALLTAALNHAVAATAAPAGSTPDPPGTYLARYVHRVELPSYLALMRMLDLSDASSYSGFFSDNIGSLASALDVIESVSVTVTDDGAIRREALRYALD